MDIVTLLVDQRSSKTVDGVTANSDSIPDAANLSDASRLSEVDEESATSTIGETENESEDTCVIYAVHRAKTETNNEDFMSLIHGDMMEELFGDQTEEMRLNVVKALSDLDEANHENATIDMTETDSESEDASATHPVNHQCETVNQVETAADSKSSISAIDKAMREQCLREQTEETKLNLFELTRDTSMDDVPRSFALAVAMMVDWWQYYAQEVCPTSFQIPFGSPMTLLMIFALLPEKYQHWISVEDENRSPFGNGQSLSWIHEGSMDSIVSISMDPAPTSHIFGRGLASMMRTDVDEAWQDITGKPWLEDQLNLLSDGKIEAEPYRFPPWTKKIVFFYNPTEVHWTVVGVDLSDKVWTYTLYNSFSHGKKGPTWNACQEHFPLLERLICCASGFLEPETREIVLGTSAQQDDAYDCGPIAIYNAMELLEGRGPRDEVDTEGLRLKYLTLILDALILLNEELELPEFRARMRKIWIDSL